jgi:hypothetical protein
LVDCTEEDIFYAAKDKLEKLTRKLLTVESRNCGQIDMSSALKTENSKGQNLDKALLNEVDDILDRSIRLVADLPREDQLTFDQMQNYLREAKIDDVIERATDKRKTLMPSASGSPLDVYRAYETEGLRHFTRFECRF